MNKYECVCDKLKKLGCLLYRRGCYDIRWEDVILLLKISEEGGYNAFEYLDKCKNLEYIHPKPKYDYMHPEGTTEGTHSDDMAKVKMLHSFGIVSDEELNNFSQRVDLLWGNKQRRDSYEYRRKTSSHHTSKPSVRRQIFDRDGAKCAECGTTKNLTIDHIVPVKAGGGDEPENLQVLCRSCNSAKGAKI